MTLEVPVSAIGLVVAFVAQFGLSGFAFAKYSDGTTKGAAYSYVQPDDRTFAVWSIIYVLHAIAIATEVLSGYEVQNMASVRAWLALNYLSSGTWLVVNGAASQGFSHWLGVVVLFVTFFSLWNVYTLLDVDYTNPNVSLYTKLTLFGAVSANTCWVTLAAVLNLANTVYDPSNTSTTQVGSADFAIGVVGLVSLLTVCMVITRMDLFFAGVCVWALLGIHRNQLAGGNSPNPGSSDLDSTAIASIVVVVLAAVAGVVLYMLQKDASSSKLTSPLLHN